MKKKHPVYHEDAKKGDRKTEENYLEPKRNLKRKIGNDKK